MTLLSFIMPSTRKALPRRSKIAADRRLRTVCMRLLLLVVLLAIWQVASLGSSAFIVPGPARVWRTWTGLVGTPTFWNDFGITFWRITVGFAFSLVIGTV